MKCSPKIGDRIGSIVVVGVGAKQGQWVVKCDCGATRMRWINRIGADAYCATACPMYLEARRRYVRTHGATSGRARRSEYGIWTSMIQRCTNPNRPSYQRYGGAGVRVCDRWLSSFEDFISDVGDRPSPGHSLDRINVYGNYEPGNVRWASRSEQARNKRNSKLEPHEPEQIRWLDSEGLRRSEIARHFGVSPSLVGAICKGLVWADQEES